ncbi:hypothetical protein [Acinetobacter sp. CFCC 10889]|uniref:hypothetical protein n=1 Tax=Acinetobacter sp. CFCC 10889 TaxID=1775557 RepID=UPI000DCFF719|nr:hypothetical protein [Acinetobacter sp. CFCC 10889]
MFSTSKIAIETIGPESLYVLEKSGSAIFKEPGVDTDLAKSLLKSHKENFQKLKAVIDQKSIYDNSYFDYEFKTMFYAIDKLLLAIENIKNEDDELEAVIFHKHICKQNDKIRKAIEESENN